MKALFILAVFLLIFVDNYFPKKPLKDDLQCRQYSSSVKIYDSCCSHGSGTLIDDYILTNYHVIKNEKIGGWVLVNFSTNSTGLAQVIVIDSIHDLAIIKPNIIPIDTLHRVHVSDLYVRNKKPRKNEKFLGYGSPKLLGDYQEITVSFFKKSNETVVRYNSGKRLVLYGMYTVKREYSVPYGGASGTLMLSKNSYGIFTSDALWNERSSSLVNREDIINIIKKSHRIK